MSKLPEIRDLKSLLEKYYNKNVEILQIKTKLLTAPGENYGSVILSVDSTLKIENIISEKNFVAKLCPANQMLCEIFNIQETFKKELSMYLDAIPALAELEEEYGIKENKFEDLFAKCLGGRINLNNSSVVDNDAVLLLENLKTIGYDTEDRLIGFNFQDSELIIKNLARFHAVPIVLKLLKPEVFEEKVLPGVKGVSLGDALNEKNVEYMTSEVMDVLKTNSKCLPYIDRIEKSIEYNLVGPYRLENPLGPFATIVHSDFWTNNTMILKNSKGEPVHNKIVDLQLPMYNSGVHDLLFFLFSSVISSVLQPNIDYFIKLYYDSFIERLSKFKIDLAQFSWKRFNDEIVNIGPLELGHTLIMFKPILTERGVIDDMANFDESILQKKDIVSEDFDEKIISTVLCYIERKWI